MSYNYVNGRTMEAIISSKKHDALSVLLLHVTPYRQILVFHIISNVAVGDQLGMYSSLIVDYLINLLGNSEDGLFIAMELDPQTFNKRPHSNLV